MGALITIWLIGIPIAYFVFRSRRVNAHVLAALFWPVMALILFAAALSNPNSALRRDARGATPSAPTEQTISRPRYGLVETADGRSEDQGTT